MDSERPIKRWRKAQNLTQAELGAQIGIGATQVAQIESGERGCSLGVALRIRALAGDAVPLESLVSAAAQQPEAAE